MDTEATSTSFGWRSQTYSAYIHLLVVKLWQRLYYGGNDEPERLGEAYSSIMEKWHDFWSDSPTEIAENLYLGSAKNAADAGSLSRLRITYIVNCTEDLPQFHEDVSGGPEYNRVPLKDVPGASLFAVRDSIEFVVSKIIDKLRRGERVLIHCLMGASRSVAVATLVLMKLQESTAMEAYARVSRARRAAKINRSFMDDLRAWQFE